MSWRGGYKPSTSKQAEEDLRETKRKKLEAERALRAEQRLKRQEELESIAQARHKTDQAVKDLLAVEPDILAGEDTFVSEGEIDNLLALEPASEDTVDESVEQEPARMAAFEDENGTDDAGALGNALKSLEKLQWNEADIKIFFNKAETRMTVAGVKKNFTKFQVLSEILPQTVQDECKPLMNKGESDFAENNGYKLLKQEVLRIFGPRLEDAMERALARVMTGKPSQLARALVNDLAKCPSQLNCTCCPGIISAMWKRQLPSNVRAGIAHMEFNQTNYNAILQLADDIHSATAIPAVSAVSAVTNLNETQPALPYPVPEVSAIRGGRGRGNRGRGGRGRGGRGSSGGAANGSQPQPPKHKGTKHPDLPPGEWRGCGMHFRWGRGSYFCSEPSTCPWRDIYAAKPAKQ